MEKNKEFENPISAAVIAISVLIIFMLYQIEAIATGTKKETVAVTGDILFNNVGVKVIFQESSSALQTPNYSCSFPRKYLHVNLVGKVPKAVGDSFSTLIPSILVLSIFGLISSFWISAPKQTQSV